MDKIELENQINQVRSEYGKAYDAVKATEQLLNAHKDSELMAKELTALLEERRKKQKDLQIQLHHLEMTLRGLNDGSISLEPNIKYQHMQRSLMDEETKLQVISDIGLTEYSKLKW